MREREKNTESVGGIKRKTEVENMTDMQRKNEMAREIERKT